MPSLLPALCRDLLLSLTSGLDAESAAAAALAQAGADPLQPGQDPHNFIGPWQLLLCTAAAVSHTLLVFFSPCCSSDAERQRLAASVMACVGAICVACSALVRLW